MNIIITILIGAGAGWLANELMEKDKKSFLRNLLLGIVGGFFGGLIFRFFQLKSTGTIGEFITAFVGSIVVIWLVGKLRK